LRHQWRHAAARGRGDRPRGAKVIPGDHLGIHAHNDTEQAVANSLAAVRGGARQIQGTLNGLGERCGNANLTSLIPTLKLKDVLCGPFEIGVTEALQGHRVSRIGLTRSSTAQPNRQAPYVGASAFATKAGIHASAIVKDPRTYEHVEPESVGNHRRCWCPIRRAARTCLAELSALGITVDKGDPSLDALLDEVKEREAVGYSL
jgi:2-isopropylmalate synthase